MAQGFKGKAPQGLKSRSVASERKSKGVMKKGGRSIPPKQRDLIEQAAKKKSSTSGHGQRLEEEYAKQAIAKGKLSGMMKKVSEREAPGVQTPKKKE
ncbi:hypothetical protein P389DRAFT_198613 [Cystobasidium minutum MCA 4210]|uniref:uncharacterized protein n=1 Tax=Cystobasidium minutum MCA 4210 TaxID=1397322 RepID=UPI0034CE1EDA|eukprot:jgi/Rhomi1/198613/gm1.6827_g